MDRVTAWLIGKLDEHASEFQGLGGMIESLANCQGMVGGMVLSPNYDRPAVLAHAAKILATWLPQLSAGQLRRVGELAARHALSIDVASYLPAAERQDAEREAQANAEEAKRTAALEASREKVGKLERNPELERALDDDTDEAFDVYADWLEGNGMIRGDLIHLMLRGEPVDAFIEEHADELLGDVPDEGCATLEWKRGFIDELTLSSDDGVTDTLEHFLGHPSGRRLRSLVIGMDGESGEDQGACLPTLVKWHPDHLKSLFIGAFDQEQCEISWYQIGDVSSIWRGLPALDTVILNAGGFLLGTIVAPQLETLVLRTGGLTSDNVRSIAQADWPKLRHLDVCFGEHTYGGNTTIADVHALLANRFPALRHLGIMNCPFVDEAVAALVASPLARQLEEVDLSMGCLGDEGARRALELPNVKKLDISSSFVSDAVQAELAARFELVAGAMNDPGEDRYVAISE